jgi:hypothetical protein
VIVTAALVRATSSSGNTVRWLVVKTISGSVAVAARTARTSPTSSTSRASGADQPLFRGRAGWAAAP